jgi:hypothetical protein
MVEVWKSELRYDQENEQSELREGETNLALPCL